MAILLIMLLGLSACSKKETEQKEPAVQKEGQEQEKKEESVVNEKKQEAESEIQEEESTEEENSQEEAGSEVEITLYVINEDGTGFTEKPVVLESRSAENILAELAANGVLPSDVKVNKMTELEDEGEKALEVDFSQEFADYLNTAGSTGEYLVAGSVCNTFLSAYDCQKIRITADGNFIKTGHAEYAGYQRYYE